MIKKNDVLKSKEEIFSIKVLGICDDLYCMSSANGFDEVGGWYTLSELERDYVIPKEEYRPKINQIYFIINEYGETECRTSWGSQGDPTECPFLLGCWPTEKLAEQALAEIKRKIKE